MGTRKVIKKSNNAPSVVAPTAAASSGDEVGEEVSATQDEEAEEEEEEEEDEGEDEEDEEEEDVKCLICNGESSSRKNQIVLCDGKDCDIPVHQLCYGIERVPSGEWLCDKCKSTTATTTSPLAAAVLVCCPDSPSLPCAVKQTSSGSLLHLLCALYNRKVNTNVLDLSVEAPDVSLLNANECYICSEKFGLTVPCHHLGCSKYFHVMCSLQKHQLVQLKPPKAIKVNPDLYCLEHRKSSSSNNIHDDDRDKEILNNSADKRKKSGSLSSSPFSSRKRKRLAGNATRRSTSDSTHSPDSESENEEGEEEEEEGGEEEEHEEGEEMEDDAVASESVPRSQKSSRAGSFNSKPPSSGAAAASATSGGANGHRNSFFKKSRMNSIVEIDVNNINKPLTTSTSALGPSFGKGPTSSNSATSNHSSSNNNNNRPNSGNGGNPNNSGNGNFANHSLLKVKSSFELDTNSNISNVNQVLSRFIADQEAKLADLKSSLGQPTNSKLLPPPSPATKSPAIQTRAPSNGSNNKNDELFALLDTSFDQLEKSQKTKLDEDYKQLQLRMEQLEQDAVVSAMQLKKLRDENAFLKKDSSTLKSRLLSIFTSLKLPMPYLPTTRNIDQYIQMLYENIQRFFKSDPLAAATYLEKVLDVVTNPPPPPPA